MQADSSLRRIRQARWHDHVNHVQAPVGLRHWLTDCGSLTAKLVAHSTRFRVERISQRQETCWSDQAAPIRLARAQRTHSREVLLRCDEVATVYAHTVMPLTSSAAEWPRFRALGNRSLGSTLFSDPLVRRGAMQFARLFPDHPAMQRARCLTSTEFDPELARCFHGVLYARRSLFYRASGIMLVTELFLPTVSRLQLPVTQADL